MSIFTTFVSVSKYQMLWGCTWKCHAWIYFNVLKWKCTDRNWNFNDLYWFAKTNWTTYLIKLNWKSENFESQKIVQQKKESRWFTYTEIISDIDDVVRWKIGRWNWWYLHINLDDFIWIFNTSGHSFLDDRLFLFAFALSCIATTNSWLRSKKVNMLHRKEKIQIKQLNFTMQL